MMKGEKCKGERITNLTRLSHSLALLTFKCHQVNGEEISKRRKWKKIDSDLELMLSASLYPPIALVKQLLESYMHFMLWFGSF